MSPRRSLLTSRAATLFRHVCVCSNLESYESRALLNDEAIAFALMIQKCLARGRDAVLEMAPWMLRDYHIHHPGKCVLEILRKERMANPFSRRWFSLSFVLRLWVPIIGIGHWRTGSWELAHLLVKLHRDWESKTPNRNARDAFNSRFIIIKKTHITRQIFCYRYVIHWKRC